MTILPDGRWKLTTMEKEKRVWEKIKGWKLAADGNHLIPDFPKCSLRVLEKICKPCGRVSTVNYYCTLKKTFVSVSYCKGCTDAVT